MSTSQTLKVREILSNPFKKHINNGSLDEETIAKIRANMQELGLMGALPVFEKEGKYHLVSGHHRLEAIKREYGKDHLVEVVVHAYDEDQVLRGMVVENLTQRNGEFREEADNLLTIREYLKNHPEFNSVRSADRITDSNPKGAGAPPEPGSVRHISMWLDKETGDVMKRTKINDILRICENLDEEILLKVGKRDHSVNVGQDKETLGIKDAIEISTVKDKQEQKFLADAILTNEDLNQRDRIELVRKFKNLPDEERKEVLSGEANLEELQKATPREMGAGEMSLTFNKRASGLVIEMRALRSTLNQFRKEKLFDQFTPKQRSSFRDRLSAVRKEYGELVRELEESLEVLQ